MKAFTKKYLIYPLIVIVIGGVIVVFIGKKIPTREQSKTPPNVTLSCIYDTSRHVSIVKFKADDRDLRIISVKGVKKGGQGYVPLKESKDLPDSGLVREKREVEIPVEDSVVQNQKLVGIFILYTDQPYKPKPRTFDATVTLDTVEINMAKSKKKPLEVSTKKVHMQRSEYCVFCPSLEVGDSLRFIITRGFGGKIDLDTLLRKRSVKDSPNLSIKRSWIDKGYCYQMAKNNEPLSPPQSLSELLK